MKWNNSKDLELRNVIKDYTKQLKRMNDNIENLNNQLNKKLNHYGDNK